jgi:AcrR family transcriptional regulator
LIRQGALVDGLVQRRGRGGPLGDGAGGSGGGVGCDGGLGVLVAGLRGRLDEIEGAIFARVREIVRVGAGEDDVEYLRGLRATVHAGVEFVLEGIERTGEGEGMVVVPREPVLQARRAARVGVSVDAVIRRYMVGQALLWEFVLEEADGVALADGGRRLRETLHAQSVLADRLLVDVAHEHGRELRRADHSRERPLRRQLDGRDCEAQRERILWAMVQLAGEQGFANVSVRSLAGRAGVSTRAFYEQFDGLRDCFETVLDLALERAGGLIAQAFAREERWQDGVLGALASLLVYFDSEPLLTRVWFVEAIAAGSWALERREHIVARLRSMIIEYWTLPNKQRIEPRTAAGVMASVLGLIQAHVVAEEPEPLIELLGPLIGLVTAHYLDRPRAAREVNRATALAHAIHTGQTTWTPALPTDTQQPLPTVPLALAHPRASRARACLRYLAQHPDGSNREIATAIGVTHKSQISTLLSDLHHKHLLEKRSEGPGKRNAWRLTPTGTQTAQTLTQVEHPPTNPRVRRPRP